MLNMSLFAPDLKRGQIAWKDELIRKLQCYGNLLPIDIFEILRPIG